MRKTKSIFFLYACALIWALSSCAHNHQQRTQNEPSVFGIIDSAQYGETHAFANWHGRYWEVFGREGELPFEAMTLRADMDCYQTLCDEIQEEIGAEPIESKTYMLTERVHTVDDWTNADLDSMIFQNAWHKGGLRIDISTNRIDQTVTIVLNSLDESKNTFHFE